MDRRNSQEVLPRGFRNNNPLNLVRTSETWEGKIPFNESTDSRFEQFYDSVDGIRAGMINIINDIADEGLNTINKLISAYSEGDTTNYVDFVSKALGVNKDDTIIYNIDSFSDLIENMIFFENGKNVNSIEITAAFAKVPDTAKQKLIKSNKSDNMSDSDNTIKLGIGIASTLIIGLTLLKIFG